MVKKVSFNVVQGAGTFERKTLKDTLKQSVRTVVALEVEDLLYVPNGPARFNTLLAQVQADNAAWPALASEFVDHVAAWSVGLDAKDAKAFAQGIKKAANKHFEAVLSTTQTRTLSTYIGQLAKGASLSPQVSVVKTFTDAGVPATLYGWTMFSKLVAGTAGKESADDCLKRLCKAMDTHAGSQVTPGIVSGTDCATMITALLGALGNAGMTTALEVAREALQDAQAASAASDKREDTAQTSANRAAIVQAMTVEGAAAEA